MGRPHTLEISASAAMPPAHPPRCPRARRRWRARRGLDDGRAGRDRGRHRLRPARLRELRRHLGRLDRRRPPGRGQRSAPPRHDRDRDRDGRADSPSAGLAAAARCRPPGAPGPGRWPPRSTFAPLALGHRRPRRGDDARRPAPAAAPPERNARRPAPAGRALRRPVRRTSAGGGGRPQTRAARGVRQPGRSVGLGRRRRSRRRAPSPGCSRRSRSATASTSTAGSGARRTSTSPPAGARPACSA